MHTTVVANIYENHNSHMHSTNCTFPFDILLERGGVDEALGVDEEVGGVDGVVAPDLGRDDVVQALEALVDDGPGVLLGDGRREARDDPLQGQAARRVQLGALPTATTIV